MEEWYKRYLAESEYFTNTAGTISIAALLSCLEDYFVAEEGMSSFQAQLWIIQKVIAHFQDYLDNDTLERFKGLQS